MQECGRKHYTSHATCPTSSKKLAICTCRCEQWLHDKEALLEYWSISYKKKQANNHGQKSWDTLAFLWHFPIHTIMPNPSPHPTSWICVVRILSEFQICIGWGEGELQENFENDALFYKGTYKLQKIMSTALLSQCKFFSP